MDTTKLGNRELLEQYIVAGSIDEVVRRRSLKRHRGRAKSDSFQEFVAS